MARRPAPSRTQTDGLPVDVRLMNATAALFAVVGAVAIATVAVLWMAKQPVFALRAIRVEGDVARNTVATLRANAMPHLAGNFFSLDLQRAREAFESVPWVRHAVVQRVWPSRLRVQLEEHKPAAYWETKAEGADADSEATVERLLVNSFGELFQANLGDVEDEDLPVLSGPANSSAHMLVLWQQLQQLSKRLDDGVERLDLSGRGSWRVHLDKGAVIELGRGGEDQVVARTERFVQTLPRVEARYQRPLESADLRHADGFAVRLKGVTTAEQPPGRKK